MKQTQLIMGMPITVDIIGNEAQKQLFEDIFQYFRQIDDRFSLYKKQSEISRINRGEVSKGGYSQEMKQIIELAEKTKADTAGFFDIHDQVKKVIDPSGIVKGWAIHQASQMLKKSGVKNFYIEAGGDIQVAGKNSQQELWKVGIKNPFNSQEIVKVIEIQTEGVATSGTYERGNHIYNPKSKQPATEVASITVIGSNIYEADRFATAAFAMGEEGINFIEKQPMGEGYMVGYNGVATMTTGFQKFVVNN